MGLHKKYKPATPKQAHRRKQHREWYYRNKEALKIKRELRISLDEARKIHFEDQVARKVS